MNKETHKDSHKDTADTVSQISDKVERTEIPEKYPHRAVRKFAKLIYYNGGKTELGRDACIKLGERVELILRENCDSKEEYTERAFTFVENVTSRPLKIKSAILKNRNQQHSQFFRDCVIKLFGM